MSYVNDIENIFAAICADFSADLGVDLTIDLSHFRSVSSGSILTKSDLVRVLTVELPKLSTSLLTYFQGGPVPTVTIEPFSTLLPLVVEGNSVAVACWQQLSLFGKKLKAPCAQELKQMMLDRLIQTDMDLPLELVDTPIIRLARLIVREVLGNQLPDFNMPFLCGSGAAAEKGLPVAQRFEPKTLAFGCGGAFLGLPVSWDTEYISRVLTVDKDARGPRVIACEPNSLMIMQSAVQLHLHDVFNSHSLTRGQVNILDQEINKDLARYGSLTGKRATIDMAEASDRVSLALVEAIFPEEWTALLFSLRSHSFVIDYGKGKAPVTHEMRKYAPMGSKLCFPVECLCFWAISCAAIMRRGNMSIKKAAKLVVVHGDDTIVPTEYTHDVIEALESVSLKVNVDKSFYEGPFRESCGGDFHNGYPVNPVRHNNMWSNGAQREENILILRNGFYSEAMWETARVCESMLSKTYPTTLLGSQLEFSLNTYIPSFVGGLLCTDSWGNPCLMTKVGTPVRMKNEENLPSNEGRYVKYWLTIHGLCRPPIGQPIVSMVGGRMKEFSEWDGDYELRRTRSKRGRIRTKCTWLFTERDQRKLRRAAVQVDLTSNYHHDKKRLSVPVLLARWLNKP